MRISTTVCALLGAAVAWSAAPPATAGCRLQYSEIPVTMQDGQPLIDAVVNGRPVRFQLATGAVFSTVTPASAKILRLPARAGSQLRLNAPGGEFDASVVTVRDLKIAGADLHDIEFLSGGGESGSDVAGMIGQNFLARRDVEYDLAKGMVRLMRAEGCRMDSVYWPAPQGASALELVTFGSDTSATSAFVEVDGRKLKAKLATGGPSYLTRAAARRMGFSPDGPGVVDAGLIHGAGPRLFRSWLMPVDTVVIGSETIRHTRLRVADTDMAEVDMLLGSDFFLSHRIYVSNAHKRMLFTYNGGPVFDLRVTTPAPQASELAAAPTAGDPFAAEPKDADGFARRGAALTERKDAMHAISDLSRAVELDPKSARYLYLRAVAHRLNRQPYLAMADVEAALAIAPDDPDARILRAALRVSGNDFAGARGDLDAVDKALPPQDDHRFRMIWLYADGQFWDLATRQAELWIRTHPEDARVASALNERCWIGAMSNADLDGALGACNRAVDRQPRVANYLDSRALVRLRRGELDRAIADYDAALALNPKIAWSLYGRSLAEQKRGMADKASADMAAALTLDATIAQKARAVGLPGQL